MLSYHFCNHPPLQESVQEMDANHQQDPAIREAFMLVKELAHISTTNGKIY